MGYHWVTVPTGQGEIRCCFVGSQPGSEVRERASLGNWELWNWVRVWPVRGAQKALEPSGQGRMRNWGDNVWSRPGKITWKEQDTSLGTPWRAAVNEHPIHKLCARSFNVYILSAYCVQGSGLCRTQPWITQDISSDKQGENAINVDTDCCGPSEKTATFHTTPTARGSA